MASRDHKLTVLFLSVLHLAAVLGYQAHFHNLPSFGSHQAISNSGSSEAHTTGGQAATSNPDDCAICAQGFSAPLFGFQPTFVPERMDVSILILHAPQNILSDYFGAISRRGPPVELPV